MADLRVSVLKISLRSQNIQTDRFFIDNPCFFATIVLSKDGKGGHDGQGGLMLSMLSWVSWGKQ
ncbi:MAG: hypothetical protein DRP66_09220 [Planctomycetota bacterium]|nr:MAG: hypothetical protein DRP66_09220 [Planctomycetota bacterium]